MAKKKKFDWTKHELPGAIQMVNSSNLRAVHFDPDTLILQVYFHARKGKPEGIYRYTPVPQIAYKELLKAESVGQYFVNNILKIGGLETHKVQ